MKIRRLIKQLQELEKSMPNAEVRLNHVRGAEALFALAVSNRPEFNNIVWIEGKDDIDLGEEISARFDNAFDNGVDELDFFMDLIETGITLEDIKQFTPNKYEYSKYFMETHGLI